MGEKIFETKTSAEKTDIDLSNKPKGIYFINIISEKGTAMKKIIIQ